MSRQSDGVSRALLWSKRLLWVALGVLAAGVVVPLVSILWWATRPAGEPGPRVALRFSGSESSHEIAARLESAGLIDNATLFRLYSEVLAPSVAVRRGPHLLERGVSPRRLLQCLGRLPSRPTAKVTLPEGYNHLQIAERLEKAGVCARAEFRASVSDPNVLRRLSIEGANAEGYLFPATYELFIDADPEIVITQFAAETRKRLARVDAATGGGLTRLREQRGWSERDVLTLASIVERESAAPDERARIASVFFNRLDDATFRPARRLQSDPTAAYGCLLHLEQLPSCVGFKGRVTPEMLRDPQNPYNTYRHAGLPPGPIANPGEGALLAVLRPETTNYLYFVLGADGRHRFGRSFEEHRRSIETGMDRSLSSGEPRR